MEGWGGGGGALQPEHNEAGSLHFLPPCCCCDNDARLISSQGVDEGPEGLRLISDIIREKLGIEVSVLMGANIASEVADGNFCETTIGPTRLVPDVHTTMLLFNWFHPLFFFPSLPTLQDPKTRHTASSSKKYFKRPTFESPSYRRATSWSCVAL